MAAVLGIDPGTWETAYVGYDATNNTVIEHGFVTNDKMLGFLRELRNRPDAYQRIGLEMIASYGMAVGKSTFDTIIWIGRMVEIMEDLRKATVNTNKPFREWRLCYRKQVTRHFCDGNKTGDTQLRAALRDRFPATGGGSNPVWGTKNQPGPLFGVTGTHKLAALGVAVFAAETNGTYNAIPETTKG